MTCEPIRWTVVPKLARGFLLCQGNEEKAQRRDGRSLEIMKDFRVDELRRLAHSSDPAPPAYAAVIISREDFHDGPLVLCILANTHHAISVHMV